MTQEHRYCNGRSPVHCPTGCGLEKHQPLVVAAEVEGQRPFHITAGNSKCWGGAGQTRRSGRELTVGLNCNLGDQRSTDSARRPISAAGLPKRPWLNIERN